MKRVLGAQPLSSYRVALEFDDGVRGTVDLSDLAGKGVFAVWADEREFSRVTVGQSGELIWAAGVDLCPDTLYLRLTGKSVSDLFPSLRPDARVA
jgi:hypothetical protein